MGIKINNLLRGLLEPSKLYVTLAGGIYKCNGMPIGDAQLKAFRERHHVTVIQTKK